MFPSIQTTKTRVSTINGKNVVQFFNSQTDLWEQDIALTFTTSGMAIFTLDTDVAAEPYVFFGALQQVAQGSTPDTNWDFLINGEGNSITFTNNCSNTQDIDIRLTLIKRDAEDLDNAIISADPRIKNVPD
ncbi:MAG: hypothetical protein ACJA13_001223 [Paraglaciecola sp.]|jgi:hypothetical protein